MNIEEVKLLLDKLDHYVNEWIISRRSSKQIITLSETELVQLKRFIAENYISALTKELGDRKYWIENEFYKKYNGFRNDNNIDSLFSDEPNFMFRGFKIYIDISKEIPGATNK